MLREEEFIVFIIITNLVEKLKLPRSSFETHTVERSQKYEMDYGIMFVESVKIGNIK